MKRYCLLLVLGGLAALPAMASTCYFSNTNCQAGGFYNFSGTISGGTAGKVDTITVGAITFTENGNVLPTASEPGSLTVTPTGTTANQNGLVTISGLNFPSSPVIVTIDFSFTSTGTDTLNLNNLTVTSNSSLISAGMISAGQFYLSESVSNLTSVTDYFSVSKTVVNPPPVNPPPVNPPPVNPNDEPSTAPEPVSLALVGLSLVGGAGFTLRRRKK